MSLQTNSVDADGLARTTDGKLYVTLGSGSVITNPSITGGTIAVDDGSVGSPSIQFASDNDGTGTGFYRSAANTIGFSVNGALVGAMDGTKFITNVIGFNIASTTAFIEKAAANSIQFGGTAGIATATARTELNKAVASIADATPTAVLTITVPNAAHSGSLLVRITCSLGAGGAIGANEATATNTYIISLTRTSGVNATAAISSAFGSAATAVAGAATVTATAAMSAVSGAVGATNTFTVNATVTRSGGSSTNHTCLVYAQLMNANATGITIA